MTKRRHRGFTTSLEQRDPGRRAALFQGLSGRSGADVSGEVAPGTAPNLRGMLLAAFGPGTRGGEIDTRTAAKKLGVSQRTVERWVRGDIRQPKPETLGKLVKASRQAATTKAGRARAIKAVRDSKAGKKLQKYGGKITVSGRQGTASKDGWYIRQTKRTIPADQDNLAPEKIEGLWQAYIDGGDQGASAYLTDLADQHYLPGWTYETIDGIDIETE